MGEVLAVMGRYEEAEEEFIRSVSMQPDFYHSVINLGKTYIARGQLDKGLEYLEGMRSQVAGSDIEKRVDAEIVMTYLTAGLEKDLDRVSAEYVAKYPDDSFSCELRGVRLAYMGRVAEGRAVMDSCLADWRQSEMYRDSEGVRQHTEVAAYQFEALAADAVGNHEAGAWNWDRALETITGLPEHEKVYGRYRLAQDLFAVGKVAAALAQVDPLLATNPRLIHVLVLKVKCHLELGQGEQAREALDQLQWSISQSDPDFPARVEAAELETLVSAMAGQ